MKRLTQLLVDTLTPLIGRDDEANTPAPFLATEEASVVTHNSPQISDHQQPQEPAAPSSFVNIPVPDESAEEHARATHQARGQFLARQEDWSALSAAIRRADHKRMATPSGMPVADLLTYGARADVVAAVEHALFDGTPADDAPVFEGIAALEDVLAETPKDYTIALMVAQAHMDIGWAWRGTGWDIEVPTQNKEAFQAHFDRAADILDDLSGIELNAPSVAAANCALLAGRVDSRDRVADDYEDLIDLAPLNPHPMRAMGYHLLPRWFGDYKTLELEARRTAARTQDIWGAGAYTWVYLDAITIDEKACAQLDIQFFIDGMRDILTRRSTQHFANLLASFCAVTLRSLASSNEKAELVRDQLSKCADWIIRDHLRELHPLVWAHAAEGFDNAARVASVHKFAEKGQTAALDVLSDVFKSEIQQGQQIVFGPNGVSVTA